MKAYKVVRQEWLGIKQGVSCVSAVAINCKLTYKIGEKTVPKIGKIFVFKEREDAEYFVKNLGSTSYMILEGEAENCKKVLLVSHRQSNVEIFWRLKKNRKGTAGIHAYAPQGSYVCDSFTPEKIVIHGSK